MVASRIFEPVGLKSLCLGKILVMRVNIAKLVINTAVMMIVIAASLFGPAGTLAWQAG